MGMMGAYYSNRSPIGDPSTIAGLKAWYKADEGVLNASDLPASDGEAVKTWQDQSGNGHDLTQANALYRPTFDEVNTNFNDESTLSYNGVNNLLSTTDAISSSTDTVFVVFRHELNTIGTAKRLMENGSFSGRSFIFQPPSNASATTLVTYSGGSFVNNFSTIRNVTYYASATFTASRSDYYVNGNLKGSNNVGNTFNSGLYVGGNAVPTSQAFDGDIAEVIYYNAELSSEDRQIVEAYFSSKYGI